MPDKTYTDLTVWLDRREDQGAWVFGVTVDGADIVLGGKKLGGVDSDLETARLAAAPAKPSSAA